MAEVGVDTPVVILCGGRGTRLQEHTQSIPKPLVEIGGRPILWHVIQIYAAQGLRRFVLCHRLQGRADRGVRRGARRGPRASRSRCVDTGLDTPTGGRITLRRASALGDAAVLRHLRRRRGRHRPRRAAGASTATTAALATMTVVRPELQFGVAELDGDGRVARLPREAALRALDQRRLLLLRARRVRLPGADSSVLEREPLEGLAADGQLRAYRHDGLLGVHGHLQGRGRCSTTCGPQGDAPVEGCWAMTRSVFVTGAYGLLGAWLVKALLDARRPRRRAAARRRAALGAAARGHRGRAATSSHGDVTDAELVERALGEYEVDTVFHLAAQTIVGTAQPLAALDLRDQRPRHLDAARGLPAARRSQRVVVAASDKAYGAARRAALPRGLRAAAALPLRRRPRPRPT